MEPMVIYFILRKISDWSLTHFYSEVHVLGRENVPADGPLLICANHHNEIIDIATLAATIPHRRQVGFWAKSSMFKNPIARFILLSSGSIPVKRSPNGVKDASSTVAPANESLFASTSRSLARPRSRGGLLNYVTGVFPDRVVGVFPEGTSYTEPQIMQVKEGAAWAALEYAKWQAENGAQDSQAEKLALVPVGIVYTDKSQYLSDISVVYGKPIRLEQVTADYIAASSANDKEKAHLAISALTATVKQKLLKLSVNAPDWETLYSADLARDIIWTGSHNTAELARISQAFVDIFSESYGPNVDSDSLSRTRATLLRYAGLLHYSGLRHCGLASLSRTTTKSQALVSASYHTLTAVSHPQFPLFFPVFVLHAPGYLLGLLAARVFGNPKLPETLAQFKVIFGGVGFGISYSICGHALTRWTMRLGSIASIPVAGIPAVDEVLRALARVGYLVQGGDGMWGRLRGGFSMAVILWLMTNALAKWHQILVKSNYTR
ncbi:hypothetical protein FA95DRAFT_1557028 [Auriscalpium vulgare]|uniref:Uncharacterized protein n=1 Tax=Auriscalpium vulgare TaxID=40419 RepID=A0ACB8RZR1_9AGAM|nr:hypothetical protein FA95DRAFT_1557028 [Auriscalpium vulgare]